jgi:hypothetical protein
VHHIKYLIHNKYFLLGIFFLVFFPLFLWLYSKNAGMFYAEELKRVGGTESVVVNEHSYDVIRGEIQNSHNRFVSPITRLKILRIAYAKLLARYSPIVALPMVDLNQVSDELARLKKSQQSLVAMQVTNDERNAIASSFYPIPFLSNLIVLEEARRVFLTTGDTQSFQAYTSAIQKTINAYRDDVELFRNEFERMVPVALEKKYVMSDVITDRESILDIFDTVSARVSNLSKDYRNYQRCLFGVISFCSHEGYIDGMSDESLEIQRVSEKDLSLANEVLAMYKKAGDGWITTETPLVQLETSACLDPSNTPPIFAIVYPPDKGFFKAIPVGDIRFVKTDRYEDPFLKYMKENGATFSPSNPLSFYHCLQFGYDLSRVFMVKAISEFASTQHFSKYIEGQDQSLVRIYEERLSPSNPVIFEEDALHYIKLVYTYALQNSVPSELINTIASLLLMNKFHVGDLVPSIDAIADVGIKRPISATEHSINLDFSPARLFLTDSGFFRLFLMDSLLTKRDIQSSFQENKLTKERQPYVFYSLLRLEEGLQQTMLEDMHFYRDFRDVL